jgi:hypothetical protein
MARQHPTQWSTHAAQRNAQLGKTGTLLRKWKALFGWLYFWLILKLMWICYKRKILFHFGSSEQRKKKFPRFTRLQKPSPRTLAFRGRGCGNWKRKTAAARAKREIPPKTPIVLFVAWPGPITHGTTWKKATTDGSHGSCVTLSL